MPTTSPKHIIVDADILRFDDPTTAMDSHKKNSASRRSIYENLRQIQQKLNPGSGQILHQADLDNLRIQCSELDLLSRRGSGSKPRYCTPFPSDVINKAYDDNAVDGDWHRPDIPKWDLDYWGRYYIAMHLGNKLLRFQDYVLHQLSPAMQARCKWGYTG